MTSQDDLVKKWRLLQEKVKRYDKLSKNTTTKRSTKQKTYEKEWKQAVTDLARLEKKIMSEGRKLHQKRLLEVKQVEQAKREPKIDLKKVYCDAQKPGKGKRVGTESECKKKGQIRMYGKKQTADMTGGNINKILVNEILDASIKKRPTKKRPTKKRPTKKGGSLPANMIQKLIVATCRLWVFIVQLAQL